MSLEELLKKRILVLDGAMGTMLESSTHGGEREYLNLSAPEVVAAVHDEYIEALADIIETNTFGANRITQEGEGRAGLASRMALEGARIARRCADRANSAASGSSRRVLVAGSVGPTSFSLTLEMRTAGEDEEIRHTYEDLVSAFSEQIDALVKGGVDFLLFETFSDTLNARAALDALSRTHPDFPAVMSICVDASGRALSGETVHEFYHSVSVWPLKAFGLNCSPGAEVLAPMIKELSSWCPLPIIFFPDAGMAGSTGSFEDKASLMAAQIRRLALKGCLNIAGGCCGTTPEHTCGMATALLGIRPRSLNPEIAEEPAPVPESGDDTLPRRIDLLMQEAADIIPSGGPLPSVALATLGGGYHDADIEMDRIYLSAMGFPVVCQASQDPAVIVREAKASGVSVMRIYCQTVLTLRRAEVLCESMMSEGMGIPLLVGGPAASPMVVSLRLAPLYPDAIYCGDARECADMVLRHDASPDSFIESERTKADLLRAEYQARTGSGVQSPGPKTVFKSSTFLREGDHKLRDLPPGEISIDQIRSSIPWDYIYEASGLGKAVREEAKIHLRQMVRGDRVKCLVTARFFEASSDGEGIAIDLPGGECRYLPMLRQEQASRKRDGHEARISLCDFVPHVKHGFKGPVGVYAISVCGDIPLPRGSRLTAEESARLTRALKEALAISAAHRLDLWTRRLLKKKQAIALRIEAGSASCPDSSLRTEILSMIPGAAVAGLSVSDDFNLSPMPSSCGFILVHTQSCRPVIREVGREQIEHYAAKRGLDPDVMSSIIENNLKKI